MPEEVHKSLQSTQLYSLFSKWVGTCHSALLTTRCQCRSTKKYVLTANPAIKSPILFVSEEVRVCYETALPPILCVSPNDVCSLKTCHYKISVFFSFKQHKLKL